MRQNNDWKERALHVLYLLIVLTVSFTFLAYCASAEAEEEPDIRLTLGHFSYHLTSDAPNNQHRLVAFTYDHWQFSSFVNSYDRDTVAFGYTDYQRTAYFDLVGYIGLSYGYTAFMGDAGQPDSEARVYPYAAFGVRYNINNHASINTIVFGDAIVPTLEWKF